MFSKTNKTKNLAPGGFEPRDFSPPVSTFTVSVVEISQYYQDGRIIGILLGGLDKLL